MTSSFSKSEDGYYNLRKAAGFSEKDVKKTNKNEEISLNDQKNEEVKQIFEKVLWNISWKFSLYNSSMSSRPFFLPSSFIKTFKNISS